MNALVATLGRVSAKQRKHDLMLRELELSMYQTNKNTLEPLINKVSVLSDRNRKMTKDIWRSISDLQEQIIELKDELKGLRESEPQAPEEPDWSAYTCNKCHTSKCEYMYDDPNKDGRCQRLYLGGHGPEEATDET
jgi:hypothetical protein